MTPISEAMRGTMDQPGCPAPGDPRISRRAPPVRYANRIDIQRRTGKLAAELRALGWSVELTPLAA